MTKEVKREKKGLTWQCALIIAISIILAMLVAMFALVARLSDFLAVGGTYFSLDSSYTWVCEADNERFSLITLDGHNLGVFLRSSGGDAETKITCKSDKDTQVGFNVTYKDHVFESDFDDEYIEVENEFDATIDKDGPDYIERS